MWKFFFLTLFLIENEKKNVNFILICLTFTFFKIYAYTLPLTFILIFLSIIHDNFSLELTVLSLS